MEDLSWISRPSLRDPVAIYAFSGWNDAAESASGALWNVLSLNDSLDVAVIDHDAFNDHQVSRPIVSYEGDDRIITWPETRIYAIETEQKRDLVVILGEEPRLRWKVFARIIAQVLSELGVSEAIALGAFIGQVPHTLPVPVVGVTDNAEQRLALGLLPPTYEGPTGITGILTDVLTQAGVTVTSLWAATPHYLSENNNPKAAQTLLVKAEALLGLDLDSAGLDRDVKAWERRVDKAISNSDEMSEYLAELEESADLYSPPPDTGGQLVDEIERFLRDN